MSTHKESEILTIPSAAVHGYLGQHQPLDEKGQPIMDDPGLIFFERVSSVISQCWTVLTILSQTKFALNMISIVGLGLVKSSILVMYKNIFAVRKFQIIVYVVLAFVVGWTISFSISHLFTCYPITVFIEPYYGNKCVQTVPMFLALLVSLEHNCSFARPDFDSTINTLTLC
jgi:hypothetical protein